MNDDILLEKEIFVDYEAVDFMYAALRNAFLTDDEDDNVYESESFRRFLALWHLFLVSAGWTEEEYFDEREDHLSDHECPKCQEESKKEKTLKSN